MDALIVLVLGIVIFVDAQPYDQSSVYLSPSHIMGSFGARAQDPAYRSMFPIQEPKLTYPRSQLPVPKLSPPYQSYPRPKIIPRPRRQNPRFWGGEDYGLRWDNRYNDGPYGKGQLVFERDKWNYMTFEPRGFEPRSYSGSMFQPNEPFNNGYRNYGWERGFRHGLLPYRYMYNNPSGFHRYSMGPYMRGVYGAGRGRRYFGRRWFGSGNEYENDENGEKSRTFGRRGRGYRLGISRRGRGIGYYEFDDDVDGDD